MTTTPKVSTGRVRVVNSKGEKPSNRHEPLSPNVLSQLKTQFMRAASVLVDRISFAKKHGEHGMMYGANRDVYEAAGYPLPNTPINYFQYFDRGDIAAAIIEKLPISAWRGGATIVEDPDSAVSTQFEKEVAVFFDRLCVWELLQEAEILARQARYSAIIIGAPFVSTTVDQQQNEPLPLLRSFDDIVYLKSLSELECVVDKKDKDPASSRFNLPIRYRLQLDDTSSRCIHWSRVIHITYNVNGLFHKPVLERIVNRLIDREKCLAAGGEATWKNADKGTMFHVPPDAVYKSGEEELLDDALKEWWQGLERTGVFRGVEPKSLGIAVPDVSGNVGMYDRAIAASTGYPQRVLFGTEEGKLAGISDDMGYGRSVDAHRHGPCERWTRMLLDRTGLAPLVYFMNWPEIDTLDAKGRAQVALLYGRANKAQRDATGRPLITTDEVRADVMGKDTIEEQSDWEATPPTSSDAGGDLSTNAFVVNATDELALLDEIITQHTNVVFAAFDESIDSAITAYDDIAIASLDMLTPEAKDAIAQDISVRFVETFQPGVESFLALAFNSGGERHLQLANERESFYRAAALDATFNTQHDRALTWLSVHGTELIDNMATDVHAAINRVLVNGASSGLTTQQIAHQLPNYIGLGDDQVKQTLALMKRLRNAEPGSVVTYGSTKVTIPAKGASDAFVNKHFNVFTSRALVVRKTRIARSELARAANAGQRELWQQAIESGALPNNVWRVYVMNTQRHADRDGTKVRVNESFEVEPGEDVNCGCTQVLEPG